VDGRRIEDSLENCVAAPLACFLRKGAVTPKLSRDASVHGDAEPRRPAAPCERADVEARLFDVAINDAEAELLVVLRGTVRPWGGPGRGLWRVQLDDGHHRIVSAQSVIAVTRVRTRAELPGSPEDKAADQ
jgi:hypothetical protein